MTTPANKQQVGGNHYKSTAQHWDYVTYTFGTGYLRAQVSKYLCRWRAKNGVQDLEKAAHFLQKLREVLADGKPPVVTLNEFVTANKIPSKEASVIAMVASSNDLYLTKAAAIIDELITEAKAAEPQSRGYVEQDKP
jgi:hypothetical protein